jgi:hypothetical protein
MKFRLLALLLLLPGACFAQSAHDAPPPGQACWPAVAAAERANQVADKLLTTISLVESGRVDPASGRVVAWPWTINAGGIGFFYDTKAQAVDAARAMHAAGVASIDVGCMQISLLHHPNAFGSLEQAFDPATNADYGAQFLTELHGKTNDWLKAIEQYHSATQALGEPYGRLVYAALPEEQRLAGLEPMDGLTAPWSGPWSANSARPGFAGAFQHSPARIIPQQSRGLGGAGGGRTLDSYRLAPVRLAFRPS